jgi:UDP-glucuronate decarboxylase
MPRLFDNRVLVTGGAGFIGSHLCTQLVNRGFDVLCVDNFLTGSKRNIAHLQRHPRFELIRHDVAEPLAIECDMIFNLACPASPVHYQADPVRTTCTSVLGALNLLQLARGLRRPAAAPAARGPLGPRQSHRPARLLWRRQALRREPVRRLPPPARRGHAHRPHLQHLRPAHAAA